MTQREVRGESGFTLVELLIVVAVLGLVMTALSAAVLVIVRVVPTNELRIDDARATRALQTWLAQDAGSTPSFVPTHATYGGYDFATTADPCGISSGFNVVALTWKENVSGSPQWIVNYRLEQSPTGGLYEVARYTCGSFATDGRLKLAGGLRNDQPCGASSSTNSGYTRATVQAGRVTNLRVCLTVSSTAGFVPVTLDVASRNPSETFS